MTSTANLDCGVSGPDSSAATHILSHIPPDILAHIFFVLRDTSDGDFFALDKPWTIKPIQLTVSHVCRAWRNVTLSHPLLWASIQVRPPWKPDLLDLLLARSEPCLIDFQLTATKDIWEQYDPSIKDLWQREGYSNDFPQKARDGALSLYRILEPHLLRCRKISIDVNHDFQEISIIFWDKIRNFPQSLPRLQDLAFQSFGGFQPFPQDDSECIISGGRFLTSLKIGMPLFIPYASNKLTNLHVSILYMSPKEFHDPIIHCTQLRTLAIYDEFGDGVWDGTVLPFHLPLLSSLQLYGLSFGVSRFLMFLSAPRLNSLVIAPLGAQVLGEYHQAIRRRICTIYPIKSLTLTLNHSTRDISREVERAVACFPGVEVVTFVGNGSENALGVLQRQERYPDRQAWPRLDALAVRSPILNVRELIVSREQWGTPLRKIYLSPEASEGQSDLVWLKERLEVVRHDVWEELRRSGMYHPYRNYGA